MKYLPFYDPEKSYEENFKDGPFGAFAQGFGNPKGVFADGGIVQPSGLNTSPKFDFLGFKVNSPFGIAAGPLVNGKFVQAALDKGFDIVVYKTVRSQKYPCHPWPNVLSVKIDGDLLLTQDRLVVDYNYNEPLSITNSFGVPSKDPEFWKKDLSEVVKYAREGQIVIGSFQGTKREGQNADEYINDYRITAKMLLETGVKAMEVNLSCPNEGSNNLLCFDIERSVKVVRAIKEVIGEVPLIAKIAYYRNENDLSFFVKEIGSFIQAISVINGMNTEVVDKDGKQILPGEGRFRSGICGHAIKWAGLDMVRKINRLRKEFNCKFQIIGVGGVATPEDFFEYRKAGADIVMSATGAMWNPYLAKEIKEKLI